MSKISDKVENFIRKMLPTTKYKKEHFVKYQGTSLLFDFFLPSYKLMIEVQGIQHFEFNAFFHKSKDDLLNQKYRDTLKTQFVAEKAYKLWSIRYDEIEDMTLEEFKTKFLEVISGRG